MSTNRDRVKFMCPFYGEYFKPNHVKKCLTFTKCLPCIQCKHFLPGLSDASNLPCIQAQFAYIIVMTNPQKTEPQVFPGVQFFHFSLAYCTFQKSLLKRAGLRRTFLHKQFLVILQLLRRALESGFLVNSLEGAGANVAAGQLRRLDRDRLQCLATVKCVLPDGLNCRT